MPLRRGLPSPHLHINAPELTESPPTEILNARTTTARLELPSDEEIRAGFASLPVPKLYINEPSELSILSFEELESDRLKRFGPRVDIGHLPLIKKLEALVPAKDEQMIEKIKKEHNVNEIDATHMISIMKKEKVDASAAKTFMELDLLTRDKAIDRIGIELKVSDAEAENIIDLISESRNLMARTGISFAEAKSRIESREPERPQSPMLSTEEFDVPLSVAPMPQFEEKKLRSYTVEQLDGVTPEILDFNFPTEFKFHTRSGTEFFVSKAGKTRPWIVMRVENERITKLKPGEVMIREASNIPVAPMSSTGPGRHKGSRSKKIKA